MKSNKNALGFELRASPEAGRAHSPALPLFSSGENALPAADRARLTALRAALQAGDRTALVSILQAPLPLPPDPSDPEERTARWVADAVACADAALANLHTVSPTARFRLSEEERTLLLRQQETLLNSLSALAQELDALRADSAAALCDIPAAQEMLLQARADLQLAILAAPEEADACTARAHRIVSQTQSLTAAARRFAALAERQSAFGAALAPLLRTLDSAAAASLDAFHLPGAPKRLLRSRRAASCEPVSDAFSPDAYRTALTRARSVWAQSLPERKRSDSDEIQDLSDGT